MRIYICALALALASTTLGHCVEGEYPTRPVTIVMGFGPGSATDVVTRVLAEGLQRKSGQPFVIMNRAGGDGIPAAQSVMRATPDGYTLLAMTNGMMGGPNKLPYNPLNDFSPISLWGTYKPLWLVAAPGKSTLNDFIDLARRRRGEVHYATGGGLTWMCMLHIQKEAGIEMTRVPYTSEQPALTNLMTDMFPLMCSIPTASQEYVRSGLLRALATTGITRDADFPDVPTVGELGIRIEIPEIVTAIVGPPGMPETVVKRIADLINEVLSEPETQARLSVSGLKARSSDPDDLVAYTKRYVDFVEKTTKDLK